MKVLWKGKYVTVEEMKSDLDYQEHRAEVLNTDRIYIKKVREAQKMGLLTDS